jgi:hypothetical protein
VSPKLRAFGIKEKAAERVLGGFFDLMWLLLVG